MAVHAQSLILKELTATALVPISCCVTGESQEVHFVLVLAGRWARRPRRGGDGLTGPS